MAPIRVLIADDHPLVREALTRALSVFEDIHVVAMAVDGVEAVERSVEFRPDVVLMDIDMPRVDGIEATKRLADRLPGVAVVGMTGMRDEAMVQRMAEAGADHVVNKASPTSEICSAVRLAGRLSEDPGDRLTDREREILRAIALGHTSKEIGINLGISPRTVDRHRANMMQKLRLRGIASLTEWAVRRGVLSEETS